MSSSVPSQQNCDPTSPTEPSGSSVTSKSDNSDELLPPPPPNGPASSSRIHFGDHSITGEGVLPYAKIENESSVEVAPNVFSKLLYMLRGGATSVVNAGGTTHSVGGRVAANKEWGETNAEEERRGTFNTWCPPNHPGTTVSAHYGHIIGPMPDSATAGYKDGNHIDTWKVESDLRFFFSMPDDCMRAISSRGLFSLMMNDNSALYAKGWLLALMRQQIVAYNADAANAQHQFVPQWAAPGTEFKTTHWHDVNAPNLIDEAIMQRRFAYVESRYSAKNINWLGHIARGGLAAGSFSDAPMVPRILLIEWFPIPTTVFFNDVQDPFVITDFSPEDMVNTLKYMALARREHHFFVQGLYKALSLLGQRGFDVGSGQTQYFTATLERATEIHWPAPLDSNPLWRWINSMNQECSLSRLYENEYRAISFSRIELLLNQAMAAAALLSLGVSLAFHRYSINARFLQAAAGLTGGLPTFMAHKLFNGSQMLDKIPLVFKGACVEISHVTGIIFDAKAMVQHAWCSNFAGIGPVNADTQWQGVWDFRIPYLLDPFCTAWALTSWPQVFGVFSGLVSMNLTKEVVRTGSGAGWYADGVDKKYTAIATSANPGKVFEYIPYGACVMNALSQLFRRAVPYPLQFRSFERARAIGKYAVCKAVEKRDLRPGDYSPVLHTYLPGVILSYDWTTDVSEAPLILKQTLEEEEWFGNINYSIKAGLILPQIGYGPQVNGMCVNRFSRIPRTRQGGGVVPRQNT